MSSFGPKDHGVQMWHLIKGSGTISTYDSFNVTSIADNGTGLYTRNLSNNFNNVNYAAAVDGGWNRAAGVSSRATSSTQTKHAFYTLGPADVDKVSVTAFGDKT